MPAISLDSDKCLNRKFEVCQHSASVGRRTLLHASHSFVLSFVCVIFAHVSLQVMVCDMVARWPMIHLFYVHPWNQKVQQGMAVREQESLEDKVFTVTNDMICASCRGSTQRKPPGGNEVCINFNCPVVRSKCLERQQASLSIKALSILRTRERMREERAKANVLGLGISIL